jgi:hypothetical protein
MGAGLKEFFCMCVIEHNVVKYYRAVKLIQLISLVTTVKRTIFIPQKRW